jgi:hypothetical protein
MRSNLASLAMLLRPGLIKMMVIAINDDDDDDDKCVFCYHNPAVATAWAAMLAWDRLLTGRPALTTYQYICQLECLC